MTAQSFSYPLRPGKFVDRSLFIELLHYVDRATPVRDAVYIGFGGPCMEDHRVVHASFGLRSLISIENDENVFRQQGFNRPLREIVCVCRDAKDFVDEFEAELRRARVKSGKPRIVWFDYEDPGSILTQLKTFQALIDLANDGDVLRITLNAHAGALGNRREGESEEGLQERRLMKLKARFGEFAPEGATGVDTQSARFPSLVLEALKLAVLRSTSRSGRTFVPLLVVTYADGQAMLTVTGTIVADDEIGHFVKATGIDSWPYYSKDWANVERVSEAPYLTTRERMLMDQAVMATRNRLPTKIEYLRNIQGRAGDELVRLYRRYQRFFPRFQHVDL